MSRPVFPIIHSLRHPTAPQLTSATILVQGENFESGSTVTVDGIAPLTTTFNSANELKIVLTNTMGVGDKPVIVTNPSDGRKSKAMTLTLFKEGAGIRRQEGKLVNQRNQPLPASMTGRTDTQRIAAGNDFLGGTPDQDIQGDPGSAAPPTIPTRGGYWSFNYPVTVTSIHFRNHGGVEPGARGATSGIYIVRRDGSEQRVIPLNNTTDDATLTDHFLINPGDAIKATTDSATIEMSVSITHIVYRARQNP